MSASLAARSVLICLLVPTVLAHRLAPDHAANKRHKHHSPKPAPHPPPTPSPQFSPQPSPPHSPHPSPVPPRPPPPAPKPPVQPDLKKPLYSGYMSISSKQGSALYYAYWEAAAAEGGVTDSTPILLWLQGGPGCASTFGALYELGPTLVGTDGQLQQNEYPWNMNAGLLIVDQPVGTGYSKAGSEEDIPSDMLGMAADLYEGLYGFFKAHPQLQPRPFFITGESYAGKYIPSIAHFILQAEASGQWRSTSQQQQEQQPDACIASYQELAKQLTTSMRQPVPALLLPLLRRQQLRNCPALLQHARQLHGDDVPPPNFHLSGIAIGNGLTDPVSQTRALAGVIYNMGLVTEATRTRMQQQAEVIIQMVDEQQWQQAAEKRDQLVEFIEEASGVATLFDVRRTTRYDSGEAVQQLLDRAEVKALLNADPAVDYVSCSATVESVMKADTMKSAMVLVGDILGVLPVLLYQGQFDGQDGVASTNAWVGNLEWAYWREFGRLEGQLWDVDGVPAGWQRNVSTLTQVVVRNAGHMVPRDQPKAAQQVINSWVQAQLEAAEEAAAALHALGTSGGSSNGSSDGSSSSSRSVALSSGSMHVSVS